MPNLASRNHSGHSYCFSDSQVGWNGPGAIGRLAAGPSLSAVATRAVARIAARMPAKARHLLIFKLRFIVVFSVSLRGSKWEAIREIAEYRPCPAIFA